MPMDRQAALQLGLLLMAVPTQYLVSKYLSTPEAQRSYALKNIMSTAVSLRDKYMSWKYWQNLCVDLLAQVHNAQGPDDNDDDHGESPAYEVLKYQDPEGYFAS